VANLVVLGRVEFKPRDLGSDRGYRGAGDWADWRRLDGVNGESERMELDNFFDLADMGRSVLRPYTVIG
jgi:hypothetical protein